jgi:hypothetical protein
MWVKAGKWFKEIVKDYDRFMVKYTTSGQAQPDFHGYVEGKNHVHYYCLFIEKKPETHKSLTLVLNDELFSELTKKLGTTEGKKDSSSTKKLKATQVVLQAVADSMTDSMTDRLLDSRSHQMKRDEKMSLDNEIGQIHMNLLKLPPDASGDPARVHFNTQLENNTCRIRVLEKYFNENNSPTRK